MKFGKEKFLNWGCGKSWKMTIFRTCLVVSVKRVCVFCFAKALRTVLDYWQFENLHSLSFAIAKQLLISIFSLGRRSVRYCSLQPCQNPLCRQSAAWLSALNGHAIASALCRQSAFLSLKLSFFPFILCILPSISHAV